MFRYDAFPLYISILSGFKGECIFIYSILKVSSELTSFGRLCFLVRASARATANTRCIPNYILSVAYQNFYAITSIVSLAFRLLIYHFIISASVMSWLVLLNVNLLSKPIDSRSYPPRVDAKTLTLYTTGTEVPCLCARNEHVLWIHLRSFSLLCLYQKTFASVSLSRLSVPR